MFFMNGTVPGATVNWTVAPFSASDSHGILSRNATNFKLCTVSFKKSNVEHVNAGGHSSTLPAHATNWHVDELRNLRSQTPPLYQRFILPIYFEVV